jgi:hypothetical protein
VAGGYSFSAMEPDTLLSKAANCLVEDAQAKEHLAGSVAAGMTGMHIAGAVDRGVNRAITRRKAKEGGLWVGGRLVVTNSRLTFTPNAANRAVHTQLPEVSVELDAIRSVTLLPGLITQIILVETDDRSVRFRCFGAASVAERLREAARAQSCRTHL